MNFKTTAVLLVLLLAGGAYLLFTRDKTGTDTAKPPAAAPTVLPNVASADVTGLTIADAAGKPILAVEKVSDASAAAPVWRLTKPVGAPADTSKVSSLVDELTALHPTNAISAAADPKAAVAKPQYTVTLTAAGKPVTLLVGDRLGVGDGVYVQPAGSDSVSVVSPTLLDTLARPANDLRNAQLVTATPTDIKQVTLTHADGSKLSLVKDGSAWRITAPKPAPADATAVDDLLYAVTGLSASAYVDDPAAVATGLSRPQIAVAYSTAAPTTAPTSGPSTQPAMTTVTLGNYATVEKADVYATVSNGPTVKVAAATIESLNKTELDLRDKVVLDVDPAKVTQLTIAVETPATTQPAAHPASVKTVVLTRRPPKPVMMGPVRPTTGPASRPATAPVKPATVWTANGADADDARITTLLDELHPLRADKFLADSVVKNPDRRFTVTIVTGSSPPTVVHVADPGHDLSLIGTTADLTFNLPATMAADLTGTFKAGDAPPPAPTPTMPPGMGGLSPMR